MNIFDVDDWVYEGFSGGYPRPEMAHDDFYVICVNAGRKLAGLDCAQSYPVPHRPGCASLLDSEHPASFRADA